MKIAIIDDERQALEELQQALQLCGIKNVIQAEVQMFTSGENFLQVFKPEDFQLIFLDICMEGINGIKTALAIRQQAERLPIIFLTSSADYALEGYQVFPAGYLLKPINRAVPQLKDILHHCLPDLMANIINVQRHGRMLQINIERIAYIDVQGGRRVGGRRGSVIHLQTGETMPVDTSYTEAATALEQRGFVECYNRLMVNLAAVETLMADSFVLKNGEQLPISRRLYRETAHEYMEYLLRK